MAFRTQKISQMTPKGADLEATDLIEVSTIESGSYVTRSITGQELIDAIPLPPTGLTVGTVSASTYNIDTSLSNIFDITLGNNVTFTFTNPPASGYSRPVVIVLRQDGSGNRTATFTNAKYTEGQTPTLSTGASDIDVLTFFTVDAGSSWFGTFAMANVS